MARHRKKYARRRNGSHRKPPAKHHAMFPRYGGKRIKRRRADKLVLRKRRAYRKYRRGALARGQVPIGSRGSNPGPAIQLVRTKSGMQMLETTPRYDVMLFGRKVDQLYFNMRGYVGYLPTPDGKKLDIGEHGIGVFKKEVAKLNREFKQKLEEDNDRLRKHTGLSMNPALRPFAGAKGRIQYPYWEVLGRNFADSETAHVFAQQKALDTGEKVEVWYKPDTWTSIMHNYTVDPAHVKTYNPIIGIHSKIYTERTKIPKWNGTQSILSLTSIPAAGKLLRSRLPNWTKAQHKHAAEDAFRKAKQVQAAYSKMLDTAAMETFKRPYQATDYRISGIASDRFSEKRKNQLRHLAQSIGKLTDIGRAHEWASKHAWVK